MRGVWTLILDKLGEVLGLGEQWHWKVRLNQDGGVFLCYGSCLVHTEFQGRAAISTLGKGTDHPTAMLICKDQIENQQWGPGQMALGLERWLSG